jgi:delta 1-pyrroline-5-carboxylate dehydrogenase
MTIAREEIFGPVLAVIPFESEAEAVSLANDSMYGLAAGLWTRDIKRGHRVAHKLEAGTVWVNAYNRYDTATPFGGYKESGFGRDMGPEALDGYLQTKSVWIDLSEDRGCAAVRLSSRARCAPRSASSAAGSPPCTWRISEPQWRAKPLSRPA